MKACTKCKETKSLDEFYGSVAAPDGLQYHCKECQKKASRARQDSRIVTEEQRLRKNKQQREVYYPKNREAIIERTTVYTKANPEMRQGIDRRYHQNNAEKVREKSARRRLAKKGQTVGKVDYVEVRQRDEDVCHICETPIDATLLWPDPQSLTFDHVIPLARGGEHSMDNIRVAHARCNIKKGTT